MPCVSFQHWFHLKIVKILICKARATLLCWRRRSFGKRELIFHNSSVNFKYMTLKKETCIYISLFLSNPVERGFQGFPWRNELYTVSFCLEHSLAGDCHIWWVRKVRYSNHFKSLQNYQLQILMTHGSVSDMSLRKRDLCLMLRVVSFLWRWSQKISNTSLSN